MKILLVEDEAVTRLTLRAIGSWGSLERYIERHSKAEFSHGVCPECYEKHLKPQLG